MKALLLGAWLALGASPAGAIDLVPGVEGRLELREGTRSLGTVTLTMPPAARGQPTLREVRVEGRRVLEVRVPRQAAATAPRAELWIGEVQGAGTRLLWQGLVGARDADGETALEVSVEPTGIWEYQTATRVTRCDGVRPRLHPRRFDFRARVFRNVPLPLPEPAATTLTAVRGATDMPTGRPRVRYSFTTASTAPAGVGPEQGEADARLIVAPLALNDGDDGTVWAEGAPGDGRGVFLTARAAASGQAITGLRVLPGDTRSWDSFRRRARPRALTLIFGPGANERVDVTLAESGLPDQDAHRRPFWIPLPSPVTTSCVTVLVRDVIAGTDPRDRDTAVFADIDVFTNLDGPEGLSRVVATLAEGTACEARVRDVAALGKEALPALTAALATASGAGKTCVLEATSQIASTGQVPAVEAEALAAALPAALRGADPEQERHVLALLAGLAPAPVAALARALVDDTTFAEDRVRAVRGLAVLAEGAGRGVLLGAAGAGQPEVRRAVREALGAPSQAMEPSLARRGASREERNPSGAGGGSGGRAATLLAALQATPPEAHARRADLVFALGVAGARDEDPGRAEARSAIASLAAGTEAAGADGGDFEVRARAVEALGRFGDDEAAMTLGRIRASSADPVLRYLAARELVASASPLALPALRAALDDADPRVRETAAQGLAHKRDGGAAALLVAGAKQEPWPMVRRAQIGALGRLCGPAAGDLLVRAVERDVDEVRRAALVGLAECRDPRAGRLLLATLGRRLESASLRTLSAGLLAKVKDQRVAPDMVTALERVVVESQADLSLEPVAVATLRGLVEIGGPPAVRAALAMRTDSRPAFKRAAYEALGRLCDPGAGTAALREAATDPDPALAAAASAGLRRCGGARPGTMP